MSIIESIPWSHELRTLAARFGDLPAVTDGQDVLTYRQLCARAHAMASALHARGVQPGECVAWSMPNCLDVVWVSYGITLSGAAESPMPHTLTPAEVQWFGSLAKFRYVVTQAARAAAFRELGLQPIAIEDIDLTDHGRTVAPIDADKWGKVVSSSGTTGKPKGLVYSHGRRWLANAMLKQALPYTPGPHSRVLLMTPFSHGAALMTAAWTDYGGVSVLLNGVDAAKVGPILERGEVDTVFAPPTVINKLAESFGDRRFASVRCVFTGTQTLTPATYAKARAMFGPVVRVTYGKGECTNPITVLAPADTERVYTDEADRPGACLGWPAAGVEIEVRDDQGKALPVGEQGEIFLRARHMYLGHIDGNGFHPLGSDGWHQTGDLGELDVRGRVWLSGRAADVIKSGGYKVNPEEIEATIGGLPACGQVCVTSLPSGYWGEVIVAAAENVQGPWTEQAQTRLANLSRHKHPRAFVDLDALPRNPQGKISRRAVRELILARYVLEDGSHPQLRAKREG